MKKTYALLIASTALTAAVGIPAWSAMRSSCDSFRETIASMFDGAKETLPPVLASNDDDDDRAYRIGSRYRDHHDDDDDDDDCEDDEGDDCIGGARNPAPAGTVAPPNNGLFGNGAPPQVKVN